ncbi:hypothetical protein DFP72DRAFT_234183 [Ephemerocybe angulata]|uniref:Uncharacterized protein n=1 Tax=Ephemerocybe angulata TaxID=980116 RepID=A0A8H6I270_9AGAR|nr:hypothetical protein DFP72DRAFT_234183 [Tulosesus angulatus]
MKTISDSTAFTALLILAFGLLALSAPVPYGSEQLYSRSKVSADSLLPRSSKAAADAGWNALKKSRRYQKLAQDGTTFAQTVYNKLNQGHSSGSSGQEAPQAGPSQTCV